MRSRTRVVRTNLVRRRTYGPPRLHAAPHPISGSRFDAASYAGGAIAPSSKDDLRGGGRAAGLNMGKMNRGHASECSWRPFRTRRRLMHTIFRDRPGLGPWVPGISSYNPVWALRLRVQTPCATPPRHGGCGVESITEEEQVLGLNTESDTQREKGTRRGGRARDDASSCRPGFCR